jgi:hypothetical protein
LLRVGLTQRRLTVRPLVARWTVKRALAAMLSV